MKCPVERTQTLPQLFLSLCSQISTNVLRTATDATHMPLARTVMDLTLVSVTKAIKEMVLTAKVIHNQIEVLVPSTSLQSIYHCLFACLLLFLHLALFRVSSPLPSGFFDSRGEKVAYFSQICIKFDEIFSNGS